MERITWGGGGGGRERGRKSWFFSAANERGEGVRILLSLRGGIR